MLTETATNYTFINTTLTPVLVANGDSIVVNGFVISDSTIVAGVLVQFLERDGTTLIDQFWITGPRFLTTWKPFLADKGLSVKIGASTTVTVTIFHSSSGA